MIKPILAEEYDASKARFPLLSSPKIDGIRAIFHEGQFWSRSGKLLPNKFLQQWGRATWDTIKPNKCWFDGELVIGKPNEPGCFNRTQSGIMTIEGMPNFTYYMFDLVTDPNLPYNLRHDYLRVAIAGYRRTLAVPSNEPCTLTLVHQVPIHNQTFLDQVENQAIEMGFEGLMLRDPLAPYKHGRSTVNEQYLLKLKRFVDDEAVIVDCIEAMMNNNELEEDEFGYADRSSHQENMVPKNMLGAFVVKSAKYDKTFKVGTGFTEEQRKDYWQRRHFMTNKVITYKYQLHGVKDVPRMPVFKGFRYD